MSALPIPPRNVTEFVPLPAQPAHVNVPDVENVTASAFAVDVPSTTITSRSKLNRVVFSMPVIILFLFLSRDSFHVSSPMTCLDLTCLKNLQATRTNFCCLIQPTEKSVWDGPDERDALDSVKQISDHAGVKPDRPKTLVLLKLLWSVRPRTVSLLDVYSEFWTNPWLVLWVLGAAKPR